MSEMHARIGGLDSRIGGLQTGQKLTLDQVQTGFDRVHHRIDNLHTTGQAHLDRLQDRIARLEAMPATSPAPPKAGLLSRLAAWMRLVTSMREWALWLSAALFAFASLSQSAAVKAVLVGVAGWLGAGN